MEYSLRPLRNALRRFSPLPLASLMALLAVLSAAWIVQRAVKRAEDSNRLVRHAQEILDQLDTVLDTLLSADAAVAKVTASSAPADLEPLARADRTIGADIDRVAVLTAGNPEQQGRIEGLRQGATRVLTGLRGLAETKRRGGVVSREQADAGRASLDTVRTMIRDLRVEEDRLLLVGAEADYAGIQRLKRVTVGMVAATVALLAVVFGLFIRDARRQQTVADTLRRTAADLEVQVAARTSELSGVNARLKSIIESAIDGIIVIDARGRIESFNQGAERLFGYTSAEVLARNVKMLMPAPYRDEHDDYLARYLVTGVKRIIGIGREVTGMRKDGSTFPLHLSVGELNVNGERKFTGILHDLSLRVQMEGQLREQATLVRLGEMAAVLAHEVKNPLAGIRGAIQVIGARLPKDSRDAAVATDIVNRIDGLNELMKDLLLFARPPRLRLAPVELGTLVSATAELLGRDPALKELQVRVDGEVPVVEADPELLKIVFVNLLVNGAHAMHNRGTINVSLSVTGDRCQLVFADGGPGIPADVLEKIFQPFFTTKSRGTGLGLSTAKRLIEAHGGTIGIACPPGGGTAVTIQLPVHNNRPAS